MSFSLDIIYFKKEISDYFLNNFNSYLTVSITSFTTNIQFFFSLQISLVVL